MCMQIRSIFPIPDEGYKMKCKLSHNLLKMRNNNTFYKHIRQIDGLVQERLNSIANALEFRNSGTNSSR